MSLAVGSRTSKILATTLLYDAWTVWAPRTDTLAVVAGRNREVWTDKSIAVCDPVAGICRTLPQPSGQVSVDPAWSPGGHQLAFVRAPAAFDVSTGGFDAAAVTAWDATHTLWVADPDGSHSHALAGGQAACDPSYSADGKTVVFVLDDAIWRLPANGGQAQRIAGPLFGLAGPDSSYGLVRWADLIAWSTAGR